MDEKYRLRNTVIEQFNALSTKERIPWIIQVVGASEIFPMAYFNQFCSQHFPGDYQTVAELVQSSRIMNFFSCIYRWCMWDEKRKQFSCANEITDFITDWTELAVYLLKDTKNLEDIGFPEDVAKVLHKRYLEREKWFKF